MGTPLFSAMALAAMVLIGTAVAQTVRPAQDSDRPSGGSSSSTSTVRVLGQDPKDEQVELEFLRPIPMDNAPAGCGVAMSERYCRTDKLPVRSFLILHQRITGKSSIDKVAIDNGCVKVDVRIGVEEDKSGKAQCVGGKPLVSLRLVLSAQPAKVR